jgi:tripartite-type tricarboxylate transporter receptor subunit TctC
MTVVVPLTPGTTIDILARLYGEVLSKRFGQQVIVSNRPGAGGLIAAQAVATAPADGYTVLLANSGHAILGTLNKNLPFDPVGDFAGVSLIGDAPTLVNVAPSLGTRTLQEFIALAKAKPGTINYGSAGIGTATHLAGAYFALRTGTNLVHVPYTVSSTIIADLLGGRIHATFAPAAFTLPLLQDGRLLALAVAADQPIREPIQVPTALAANIDYQNATWYGFLAPGKTPRAVLQVLHDAIVDVSKDPELEGKIRIQGITPRSIGLRDFDAHIRKDMDRLGPLLKTIAGPN